MVNAPLTGQEQAAHYVDGPLTARYFSEKFGHFGDWQHYRDNHGFKIFYPETENGGPLVVQSVGNPELDNVPSKPETIQTDSGECRVIDFSLEDYKLSLDSQGH